MTVEVEERMVDTQALEKLWLLEEAIKNRERVLVGGSMENENCMAPSKSVEVGESMRGFLTRLVMQRREEANMMGLCSDTVLSGENGDKEMVETFLIAELRCLDTRIKEKDEEKYGGVSQNSGSPKESVWVSKELCEKLEKIVVWRKREARWRGVLFSTMSIGGVNFDINHNTEGEVVIGPFGPAYSRVLMVLDENRGDYVSCKEILQEGGISCIERSIPSYIFQIRRIIKEKTGVDGHRVILTGHGGRRYKLV